MGIPATAAYAMYSRDVQLPEVVGALNKAGYGDEAICMVLSPAHPDASAVRDASAFNADGPRGARMIGWFSKFGAVVIPTIGFFIRSQDFFEALVSDQQCSSLSRGSGALVGLGFSPDDARRLGHALSDVGALVYVNCQSGTPLQGAVDVLKRMGAREAASMAPRAFSMAAAS